MRPRSCLAPSGSPCGELIYPASDMKEAPMTPHASALPAPNGTGLTFFLDLEPQEADFRADVLDGLTSSPKVLQPKYFYDQAGSQIFDDICRAEEYYVTRTEIALLKRIGPEVAALAGKGANVIEYGSGSSWKIRTLLDALDAPASYIALDISRDHLLEAAGSIAEDFPDVAVGAICADFSNEIVLPEGADRGPGRRLGFLPGSTIGNQTPVGARNFLKRATQLLGKGGALFIGVDLVKDKTILEAAYNDKSGHTAAFNLNLIKRMRNELGVDLHEEDFRHKAFFNDEKSRIEMHLEAKRDLSFQIDGQTIAMAEGETIHTENSYKHSVTGFQDLAREAGFEPVHVWSDENNLFTLHYLQVV